MIKWDGFTGIRSALPFHSPRQWLPRTKPCWSRWQHQSSRAENPRGAGPRDPSRCSSAVSILSTPSFPQAGDAGKCQQVREIDETQGVCTASSQSLRVLPPCPAGAAPAVVSIGRSCCGSSPSHIALSGHSSFPSHCPCAWRAAGRAAALRAGRREAVQESRGPDDALGVSRARAAGLTTCLSH